MRNLAAFVAEYIGRGGKFPAADRCELYLYFNVTGKLLGRPPGARNKAARKLDAYKDQIEKYLKMGLSISAVRKIINSQLEKALSYGSYVFFIKRDGDLAGIISEKAFFRQGHSE